MPRIWVVAVSATRQSGGMNTSVSAMSWLIMPPPRLPEIATASSTEGKAKKTSMVRMISMLSQPPANPATTPNRPPTTVASIDRDDAHQQ